MKVGVDVSKCQGHTLCAMTAPALFDLDDQDGHAVVKPAHGIVPADQQDEAQRAYQTCPEQAITLDQ